MPIPQVEPSLFTAKSQVLALKSSLSFLYPVLDSPAIKRFLPRCSVRHCTAMSSCRENNVHFISQMYVSIREAASVSFDLTRVRFLLQNFRWPFFRKHTRIPI